jgi:hypothetical protein
MGVMAVTSAAAMVVVAALLVVARVAARPVSPPQPCTFGA